MSEPAWLTAAVDQRIALMKDKLSKIKVNSDDLAADLILVMLTEPKPWAMPAEVVHWENACDNCDAYVPGTLVSGTVERKLFGHDVTIVYGACPRCIGSMS